MKEYAKSSPVTLTAVGAAAIVAVAKATGHDIAEDSAVFIVAGAALVVNEISRRKEAILGFIREVGAAFRGE